MWVVYAILAAFFAATTSILAKMGLDGISSNIAVAIRTSVVLIIAWLIVFVTRQNTEIVDMSQRNWIFLILSGLATGASWFFFFRALQIGQVSRVAAVDKFSVVITMILAFIFLGEMVTPKVIIGGILITTGTVLLVL